MLIINDNLELVRILDNTNLDEYELSDMHIEQPDEPLHELTDVGMAPASDTLHMSGLSPRNKSSSANAFRSWPFPGVLFVSLPVRHHN